MKKKIKALAMLSGGLDSTIAAKLVLEQGIECIAINYSSPFYTFDHNGKCFPKEAAKELGIEYKAIPNEEDYLQIIKNPKHGYGRGLNPCIDCRIYIIKKAKELMKKLDASFIVTGEVLGQRPMSQHGQALKTIEKESGLQGYILRPLSAHLLEITEPEKNGWVNRDDFLKIQGRSRKEQLNLAGNFDINTFTCGGGGCLLTEKKFAIKLKDLFDHKENITYRDIQLLKLGRHFRFESSKIIVGRNETENESLLAKKSGEDMIFDVPEYGSPTTLLQDNINEKAIHFAAKLTALYSDCDSQLIKVDYGNHELDRQIEITKISKEEADSFNLAFKKLSDMKNIASVLNRH